MLGRHGVSMHKGVFDAAVGEEVYALFMEEPGYAQALGRVEPFNLLAHNGLVRTPYGLVAFIIWVVAAGSAQEIRVEQFVNAQNINVLRLLSAVGNQTHFKFIVCDNGTGEVEAFVDFKNVFAFDEFVGSLAELIGHEAEGDFSAAVNHVIETMTPDDLFALTRSNP